VGQREGCYCAETHMKKRDACNHRRKTTKNRGEGLRELLQAYRSANLQITIVEIPMGLEEARGGIEPAPTRKTGRAYSRYKREKESEQKKRKLI